MASSKKSLSADEFETVSKKLESLIDDYRAIQDFATRERQSERTKQSLPQRVLQDCLDRICLVCTETFAIVERYEDLIDELMSPNEPRRSNCGTCAANYHGLLMAILLDFRWMVIRSANSEDAGISPFEAKVSEFWSKHHKKFMEKNYPTSPYHWKPTEEFAALDESIWAGNLTKNLRDQHWGRVIEILAKKPLLEHSDILTGMLMERGRVLKRLRQQEQAAGEQFEYRSEEKEATVREEPCDPPEYADRDKPLQNTKAMGWRESDETPPEDFPFGPLTGSKKDLVKWIIDEASDPRTLDKQIEKGTFWGRKNTSTSWSVWFSTQAKFDECNTRKSKSEAAVNS